MATAKNAKLQVESAQTLTTYTAMTDSGDHIYHTTSDNVWSGKDVYKPVIRPNGMVSGRNVLSTHASNDTVTIAAFTAYSEGTLHEVGATTDTITRPAGDVAKVNSITMTDAGVIAVIAGTDSATTAFDDTGRGGAGQAPLIPVDSVEIGQVRVVTQAAGVIAASEIFQVVGTHVERYDYPTWTSNNIGKGNKASVSAETYAHVKMAAAMPAIHTGPIAKKVYIQYYTPSFTELSRCTDFVPCENSQSVSSTQIYRGTVGSVTETLGQGSFTAMFSDGVTDQLLLDKDEILTVKFYPDEDLDPYILSQGYIGISRRFPASDQIQAQCTISSEVESAEFNS